MLHFGCFGEGIGMGTGNFRGTFFKELQNYGDHFQVSYEIIGIIFRNLAKLRVLLGTKICKSMRITANESQFVIL